MLSSVFVKASLHEGHRTISKLGTNNLQQNPHPGACLVMFDGSNKQHTRSQTFDRDPSQRPLPGASVISDYDELSRLTESMAWT